MSGNQLKEIKNRLNTIEEAIEYEQQQLEQYVHSQALGGYEAQSYQPIPEDYESELDNYLTRIERFKLSLDIPVIASLNGISTSGWIVTEKMVRTGSNLKGSVPLNAGMRDC